jgi:hypothetical protein
MFQRYSIQSAESIQDSRANTIGQDMMNSAETVYYMGYPARLTLQQQFPSGITNITLQQDWSQNINILTIRVRGEKDIPFCFKVNINASINSTAYAPGLRNIRMETRNSSLGNYVQIQFY